MKKSLIVGLVMVLFSGTAYAADTKGSALSAPAALATTDALYVIDNPGGTPVSCKDTIANILGLGAGSIFNAYNANLTTWAGITPGANVGTALAIATESAGSVVLFNGALGEPLTGTLTNCTGYPETGDVGGVLDDTGGAVPMLFQASTLLTVDSATPSVTGHSFFRTANQNPTTITDFLNPTDGQVIWVLVNDAITTFSFSGGIEGYSTSFLADNGAIYCFYYDATDTNWHMKGVPSTISISAIYDTVPIVDADVVTRKMTFNLSGVTAGQTSEVFVPDLECSLVADTDVDATGHIIAIQSAAAADLALSALGQIGIDDTDDSIAWHDGANGEVAGEVQISAIQHKTWSFDPDAVCDGAVDRLFLMTVGDEAPNGIIIDQWNVSYEANPDTEADLDLKYADAFIGVANAAVIDVLDTTAGVSTEDTDANINGGAAVANGKVMYLEFGTAYTEASHQIIFEMWYHAEED